MFFSIFAHKFSYLSIFCHFQLQFSKKIITFAATREKMGSF